MRFENIFNFKPKNENTSNTTLPEFSSDGKDDYQAELAGAASLQKIRDHSNLVTPILQGLAFGAMTAGGMEVGKNINDKNIKEQQEINIENKKAKEYLIESENKPQNLSEFLNNDFVSEIALLMKNDEKISYIIKSKSTLNSLIKDKNSVKFDSADSVLAAKRMVSLNSDIKKAGQGLSEEEKKVAKEKVIEMISLVEAAKLELIKHIKSDDYLNKLAQEMNISKEAAKEHQNVRLKNIINLKCDFKNSAEIFMDTNDFGYAYYSSSDNKISVPYNIDLKNKKDKEFFSEAIIHEILHETTRAQKGLSEKAIGVLEKSFKSKDKNENNRNKEYYSDPAELIVRKQILDLWLEKTGIKKFGEKFTEEHYKKLLELQKENNINPEANDLPAGADQLIDHIKPEDFTKVMNELADVQGGNKTYYHPGWEYENKENQV